MNGTFVMKEEYVKVSWTSRGINVCKRLYRQWIVRQGEMSDII